MLEKAVIQQKQKVSLSPCNRLAIFYRLQPLAPRIMQKSSLVSLLVAFYTL